MNAIVLPSGEYAAGGPLPGSTRDVLPWAPSNVPLLSAGRSTWSEPTASFWLDWLTFPKARIELPSPLTAGALPGAS